MTQRLTFNLRQTSAPFFSLARATWIPYVLARDAEGTARSVEGPNGFASYREAVGPSRFLARAHAA